MKKYYLFLILLLIGYQSFAQSFSLHFDGINDYVKVNSSPTLQATSAMTVEAWINADVWKAQIYQGSIVSNGNATGGNNGFDLRTGQNGCAEFNIAINGEWKTATTAEIMDTAKWYHIAGVYDGTQIHVYVNGFERAVTTASGSITTFSGNLAFGKSFGWTGRFFDGKIDEIRIWNVARSIEQIRASINQTLTGTETGLTGYWKMTEGTGLVAADATVNQNNGSLKYFDETAWSENYVCVLNYPNVGCTKIVSPQSAINLTASEIVSVEIVNYSLFPASSFPISYSINGNSPVNEVVTQTVARMSSLVYSFQQHANLLEHSDYEFAVKTTLVGDIDTENDLITKTITNFTTDANYAVKFDGKNDEVVIPNSPDLNPVSSLTVECWINANTWKDQIWQGTVIGKVQGDPDRGYNLGVGNNGMAEFQISDNGSWHGVQVMPMLFLHRWYHLAGVYDGSSLKLYINGILEAQTNAGAAISISDCDLMFGECPGWGGGRNFDGKIDEVRIWNVARSQQDIENNMLTTLNGTENGLVGYWKLNDGLTSTTVTDATAHGHNGTLNNFEISDTWVSGFAPIQNDVGVTAILSPTSGPDFSTEALVKIQVKNFAFNDVSNFSVSYSINGGAAITETFTGTLAHFESATYTFSNPIDISSFDTLTFVASTGLQNDVYDANNSSESIIYHSNTITAFDHVLHNFSNAGQTQNRTLIMPENMDNISQILMNITLNCPTGGCDPWDQPAKISLLAANGVEYEIGRYITPFGVACGDWNIDVTDFKSVLCGVINLKSYIQVWGASGWLLTVKFQLIEGTPEYQYTKIDELWNTDYLIYGDPNISYDLPVKTLAIAPNVQSVSLRLCTTGHGQGNTENAAEFFYPTHHILVNGTETFTQTLNNQCDNNVCSPQSGTWTFPRAGWCPGAEVQPNHYDITSYIVAGQSIALDYVLHEYTNLLNTGYNGGSHTEPHYRIHSYLISKSNSPIITIKPTQISEKQSITLQPNPSKGKFEIINNELNTKLNYSVFNSNGQIILGKKIQGNNQRFTIDLSQYPKGLYFVRVVTEKGTKVLMAIVQ